MKKSILVVDDDESIRELLRKLFEKSGYAVREAADGSAALRLMREGAGRLRRHGYHYA